MSDLEQRSNRHQEIVGIIPAGGQASRLGLLPCSKEIYPIGFNVAHGGRGFRPKVVCEDLLEKFQQAGITKTYIILRNGKWDIPQYFGDGKIWGMDLAYLIMALPFGVPYTLEQGFPFIRDALVVFGFPDIVVTPCDVCRRLLVRQEDTNADIVLGLFEAQDPQKMDMVECEEDGRVRKIEIKPVSTDLQRTWIIAVWTPKFTKFMHEQLPLVGFPEATRVVCWRRHSIGY